MTQHGRNYIAEDGMFIIRKEDDFIMGWEICLGDNDVIDNYYEREYDDEEYYKFCIDYDIPRYLINGLDETSHENSDNDEENI